MPINNKNNIENNSKISTWIIIRSILFGLCFILVASINDNPKSDQLRNPSNINEKTNFTISNPLFKHTKKLSAPIITQIKSNTNNINDGETFILTGSLSTSSIVKNIEVNWLLPTDFSIVNGSKKSFITMAEPGQEYQFQLTVKSKTSVNQVIQLIAKSQMGNAYFSNSSQFHTKLQQELDKSNKELYERTKKYIEANN